MQTLDKLTILDFGSQYTQLIARRVRELGVFTEILPAETPLQKILEQNSKGIILSGGPSSSQDQSYPVDPKLFAHDLPILGICYGMQLMNVLHQGTVKPNKTGEYGKQNITVNAESPIFKGLSTGETVWMSHGDSVDALSDDFDIIAKSHDGHVAAVQHKYLSIYGVQFHPEVSHTPKGSHIIKNFLDICRCEGNWDLSNYIEETKEEIRQTVGDGRIVSLVSGGVDSNAATVLCFEALGKDKVYPLHVDTGMMRAGESAQVVEMLESFGMDKLVFVDAKQEFLTALKGVSDPEEKRKIIGNLFMEILDREIENLDPHDGKTYICQGTLYTDLIESGKGCGKHADVIKTHHNVNPPVVEQKRRAGLIIEPNAKIFKDEVRLVSEKLGIPKELVWRHPFPGPGLAIRILGEITEVHLESLRQADQIYLEEVRRAGMYDTIWQAFAVLLPVQAVGVMGDKRKMGNVIALRAVSSTDGMTADFSDLPHELLSRVSTRIVNEVATISRVVYDVTSKPPGTIEWE